jgi:ABC-type multidrug transport system fused ATPase/permease subunit
MCSLSAFFTGVRGSLFWIAGSRANYNIRVKLHRNILLQEAAFFDVNETGYLVSRLNSDVHKIGMVISFHVNVVCRQLAQFIFGSVYLIKISPRLSLAAFAGIAVVAWISAVYGVFNRVLSEQAQDTYADGTAVADTSFSMSETIRAFDGVNTESHKYEKAQSAALDMEEIQAWGYGSHKFVSDTVQGILEASLLLGCWTIGRAGGLAAEQLTSFIFYANFVLESSNEVGDQWAKIQAAIGASSSVFDLLRRVPNVRDPPFKEPLTEVPRLLPLDDSAHFDTSKNSALVTTPSLATNGYSQDHSKQQGEQTPIIEMINATLSYGSMEVPALRQVNLQIQENDRVAVVGKSGSGKSSLLRSFLRFYDPADGLVLLNGEPLTNISRRDLAGKVAVVEQEPALFPMSLIDNVLYGIDKDSLDSSGQPCYSKKYRAAVVESLALAGLPIYPNNDLNLDLDTRVGEGGRALSGGQRQRVAIARALIRRPEVLLLDEPTAALDGESERIVILALRKAMDYSKSMVMVTHRLGVVRSLDVNRVIVLEKGEIVETGHPEDLLRIENGHYSRLAREQGISPEVPATRLHIPPVR